MASVTPLNQVLIKNQADCIQQNQEKLLCMTLCILLGGLLLIGWLNQWFGLLLMVSLTTLLSVMGIWIAGNCANKSEKSFIKSLNTISAILFGLALIAGCLNFGLLHPLSILLFIINLIYNFLYFDLNWRLLIGFTGLIAIFCLIFLDISQDSSLLPSITPAAHAGWQEQKEFVQADNLILLVSLSLVFCLLFELKARLNWLKNHYFLYDLGLLSASLNHQLLEPLQSSLHEIELLQAKLNKNTNNNIKLHKKLGCIQSKLELMEKIAICYQPLREQPQHRTNFLLSDCLTGALDILQFKIKNSRTKVIIKIKANALIPGDSSLLCQVLLNLIVNAVESFAKSKKKKRILIITAKKLHCTTNKKQMIKITLTDNGCGMSWRQVVSLKSSYCLKTPQSGLGFYLAHLIVKENLNGSIKVKSRLNQGTVIEIKLPVEKFADYLPNEKV